jgi:hypothetical protein
MLYYRKDLLEKHGLLPPHTWPELVRQAPHNAPLRRLDEATAARRPVLRWRER